MSNAVSKLEKPAGYMFAAYLALVPIAQERARKLGYCVSVHGSGNRDLDLIATPWTEDAQDVTTVHELLVKLFSPYVASSLEQPEYQAIAKPHGRTSWIIPLGRGASIDLSVFAPHK